VIVATPGDTGVIEVVIAAVVPTVATAGLLLLHVPPPEELSLAQLLEPIHTVVEDM
jgi:hypothetical protein